MSGLESWPSGDGPGSRIFYRVVRGLIVAVAKVWWRVEIDGVERLPEGPFVLAPVHRSYIDTPLMAVVPRRLRFFGKQEMWSNPALGWVFSALGGVPVARGTADRAAFNRAIELLSAGEPVVLFGEGSRKDGPVLHPLFDGPALVAGRTGVSIVPAGIGGSARSMPRGARFVWPTKIHLTIGDPIEPPSPNERGRISRGAIRATTAELSAAVQEQFDLAQARAGTPNVAPAVPGGRRHAGQGRQDV